MNLFVLYLIMLKATATTLNGPMSLPILRDELVVQRHVMTDRQLTAAVTAAQGSPGPMGIYIVAVGYFVAGPAGAAVGWLAMVTPALAAVPLARIGFRWLSSERARRAMDAAVLASAGLIAMSAIPLAQASMRDTVHLLLAAAAFLVGIRTRIPTALIISAAGILGLATAYLPRF